MTAVSGARRGRPHVSSRDEIERVAMDLFVQRGYESTTLSMIVEACGISRTSFFRYYSSKAEILWAPFDAHIRHLDRLLTESDEAMPTMTVVRQSAVEALRGSIDAEDIWLQRFRIQDSSPELGAEGSAHWITWANTVATFVARRSGLPVSAVLPQSVGGAVQAAFISMLRKWIHATETADAPLDHFVAELTPLTDMLQRWIDETCG